MLSEREREKLKVLEEKKALKDAIEGLRNDLKEARLREEDLGLKWKQLRLDNADLVEVNLMLTV